MTDFYDYYNDKYDYLAVMRKCRGGVETAGRRPGYVERYGEGLEDAFATLNPVKPFDNGKYKAYCRRQGNIACLKWCYVDIDYKKYFPEGGAPKPERVLALLYNEQIIPNMIPRPTCAIMSGTGLWLLFALKGANRDDAGPEHINALPRWKEVQRRLFAILKDYGADPEVTEDHARLMRIIGSKNPKSGKTVTYMPLSDKKYTLYELLEYIPAAEKNEKAEEKKNTWVNFDPDKKFFELRARDIAYILRNHRDFQGFREIALWIYRATLLSGGKTPDEALELTLALNNSLDNPLSEREVIRHTASANRREYKFTNQKIIEKLALDESELTGLYTIVTPEEHKRRVARRNRRNYTDRVKAAGKKLNSDRMSELDGHIVYLLQKDMSADDICKRLNISRSSFYNHKKRIGQIPVIRRVGMHRISSQSLINTASSDSPKNSASILFGRSPVIETSIQPQSEAVPGSSAASEIGRGCDLGGRTLSVTARHRARSAPVYEYEYDTG